MAHIVLYADDFSYDIWEQYCQICGESSNAISLTITFDMIDGVKAEYDYNEEEWEDEEELEEEEEKDEIIIG